MVAPGAAGAWLGVAGRARGVVGIRGADGLGDLDGLGVLATLRTIGIETPVLILSALSAVDERVRGLRAGGDDYLTKPFEFAELTARLDVLVRRRAVSPRETALQVGSLQMVWSQ